MQQGQQDNPVDLKTLHQATGSIDSLKNHPAWSRIISRLQDPPAGYKINGQSEESSIIYIRMIS
jgi:hypothetical protein